MDLRAKDDVFSAFWETTGSFFVVIDPSKGVTGLPEQWAHQQAVTLQFGDVLPVPVRDLKYDCKELEATLSFDRRPHFVTIPWAAVVTMWEKGGLAIRFPTEPPAVSESQIIPKAKRHLR